VHRAFALGELLGLAGFGCGLQCPRARRFGSHCPCHGVRFGRFGLGEFRFRQARFGFALFRLLLRGGYL